MGKRYFYLETSRGCPYGCEYCLSSTDRKVRYFSEEYVFSMLEKLKDSPLYELLEHVVEMNGSEELPLLDNMLAVNIINTLQGV